MAVGTCGFAVLPCRRNEQHEAKRLLCQYSSGYVSNTHRGSRAVPQLPAASQRLWPLQTCGWLGKPDRKLLSHCHQEKHTLRMISVFLWRHSNIHGLVIWSPVRKLYLQCSVRKWCSFIPQGIYTEQLVKEECPLSVELYISAVNTRICSTWALTFSFRDL